MPTSRVTPVGTYLDDGFTTKIAFSLDPDISLWERAATPPPLEGGDPIDTTTFWNSTYRTQAPRTLIGVGAGQMECAYDPAVYDQIIAILNTLGEITVHQPNTDTLDFQGWMRSFTPSNHEDGTMPTATVVFEVSNKTAGGTESGPNFTDGGGT